MNLHLIYNYICERGKTRVISGYTERHHIIPKCMGGSNEKSNITVLTAREHFLCHKILCELHKDNNKLKFAFWGMCNQIHKRKYKVSSRDYSYARELITPLFKIPKSESHRANLSKARIGKKSNINQTGNLNHNFNKMWIKNTLTMECIMIDKMSNIPEGWVKGRFKKGSLGKGNTKGTAWFHNKEGNEKCFQIGQDIPEGWIKGRNKSKMKFNHSKIIDKNCYHNLYTKKEMYFNKNENIPEGWIKGRSGNKKWFYNNGLKLEKLFEDGKQDAGFIKGRLPKSTF